MADAPKPIRVTFKFPDKLPAYADPVRASRLIYDSNRITMGGAVQIMHGAIVERTPFAFGILRKSITGEVLGDGSSIVGKLSTPSPYGAPVETGSKPHWPPHGPILLWVARKFGLRGREAESATFLVRRKISRTGTKGAFMFRNAFKATIPRVRKDRKSVV